MVRKVSLAGGNWSGDLSEGRTSQWLSRKARSRSSQQQRKPAAGENNLGVFQTRKEGKDARMVLPEEEGCKVSSVVGEEAGEESRFCGASRTTVKTLDFIPSVRKTMRGF